VTPSRFHITCDIDWAPDFAVYDLANRLKCEGIQATFMVTHSSDVLSDVRNLGHTLGIHPNFFPGSSQGDSPEDIMENLLKIVPDAIVMRTHGLYQSSRLLEMISKKYPTIEIDLSLLTYGSSFVEFSNLYFEGSCLRRLNYNWEDDIAFGDPKIDWANPLELARASIYDFHPIHVALNSSSSDRYRELITEMKGRLSLATPAVVGKLRQDFGVGTFLDALLQKGWTHVQLSEFR